MYLNSITINCTDERSFSKISKKKILEIACDRIEIKQPFYMTCVESILLGKERGGVIEGGAQ